MSLMTRHGGDDSDESRFQEQEHGERNILSRSGPGYTHTVIVHGLFILRPISSRLCLSATAALRVNPSAYS
jgi:hypothetical protein